jgi:hypothetical protein
MQERLERVDDEGKRQIVHCAACVPPTGCSAIGLPGSPKNDGIQSRKTAA